jgi:hypothetical protein
MADHASGSGLSQPVHGSMALVWMHPRFTQQCSFPSTGDTVRCALQPFWPFPCGRGHIPLVAMVADCPFGPPSSSCYSPVSARQTGSYLYAYQVHIFCRLSSAFSVLFCCSTWKQNCPPSHLLEHLRPPTKRSRRKIYFSASVTLVDKRDKRGKAGPRLFWDRGRRGSRFLMASWNTTLFPSDSSSRLQQPLSPLYHTASPHHYITSSLH